VRLYAWLVVGTSSESLLSVLARCNYWLSLDDGQCFVQIESCGKIVAYKNDDEAGIEHKVPGRTFR
jgi:hypothetical protein